MKTVIVRGGLGNQIFEYAFSLYLKEKTNSEVKYLRRKSGRLSAVETMELVDVFDIDIETQNWIERNKYKFFKSFQASKIAKDENLSWDNNFFDGTWQDLKFYEDMPYDWIKFRDFDLNTQNKEVIAQIQNTNSVGIHVRRGNYISKRNIGTFGDVCTAEYYTKAIEIIEQNVDNPFFYIFSNDIEWIEENFKMQNSRIISWNQDKDSYLDMYVMSQCKSCIIANSTFSYWAAYLNQPKNTIVYPKQWYNPESKLAAPNIFPKHWIGI